MFSVTPTRADDSGQAAAAACTATKWSWGVSNFGANSEFTDVLGRYRRRVRTPLQATGDGRLT
jgi:hypothetical protein